MKLIDTKCPACGGAIAPSSSGNMVVCEYCGSRFILDDEEASAFQEDVGYSDYVESSLSMADYAAEACEDFLASVDNDSFRETPKILKGLGVGSGENVYLIHDDTFMKSGKNGFAITECGLYCREMGEQATFTDWATYAGLEEPDLDGSYIRCDDASVCYFTDDSDLMPELLVLYRKLYRHAMRHA